MARQCEACARALAPDMDTTTRIVLHDAFQLPDSTLKDLIGDNRFLVVPETMVDGLIVIDEVGIIHYVNPACTALFNYPREELIGQNVKMLMPSPFREHHDAYLTRHRETGVKRIIGIGRELQGLKSNGTVFPMYLSVGQARTGDQGIFVGIIRPGFVKTPLTDRNDFSMPWLWTAEKAARHILRGIDRRRAEMTFPLALHALLSLLACLPHTRWASLAQSMRKPAENAH